MEGIALKILSIIGIAWFSFSFIIICALSSSNPNGAAGWGILGLLYAIAYAIVGLIQSLKKVNKPEINVHNQLLKINELKEKSIITEEESTKMKNDLLLVY
jgi:hypothetical protein